MCRDVLTRVPWPKQKPHIYTGGGNQEPEDWFRFQFCSVELCNPWTYPFSLLALFPLHMLKSCVEALMRICFVTAKAPCSSGGCGLLWGLHPRCEGLTGTPTCTDVRTGPCTHWTRHYQRLLGARRGSAGPGASAVGTPCLWGLCHTSRL